MTTALVRSLLALAVLCGTLASAASPASLKDLPEDQRKRLNAGEVIVNATMPPGATESARGGTAIAIVRATPEHVWSVLTDYPGHNRYYPRVVAAEVVEKDAKRVLVKYSVGIGPFSFAFHMDKYPDVRRRRIDWHLAEGQSHGLFRENSGYWQVDPADAVSLVTYAIAVRTSLPAFVTRGAEQDSLTETVTALRKLVEEGDGSRSSGEKK